MSSGRTSESNIITGMEWPRRVPHVVIEAIEHAAELVPVDVQDVTEAVAPFGMAHFPSMVRRDGGNEVGIDDRALEPVVRSTCRRLFPCTTRNASVTLNGSA